MSKKGSQRCVTVHNGINRQPRKFQLVYIKFREPGVAVTALLMKRYGYRRF